MPLIRFKLFLPTTFPPAERGIWRHSNLCAISFLSALLPRYDTVVVVVIIDRRSRIGFFLYRTRENEPELFYFSRSNAPWIWIIFFYHSSHCYLLDQSISLNSDIFNICFIVAGSGQIQLWQFLLELLSDSNNAGMSIVLEQIVLSPGCL